MLTMNIRVELDKATCMWLRDFAKSTLDTLRIMLPKSILSKVSHPYIDACLLHMEKTLVQTPVIYTNKIFGLDVMHNNYFDFDLFFRDVPSFQSQCN